MSTIPPLHPELTTLAGLHDRLALPVPAPTADGIRGQIVTLADQVMQTYHLSRDAAAIGLPTDRFAREMSWGNQCMDALTSALIDAELADILQAG